MMHKQPLKIKKLSAAELGQLARGSYVAWLGKSSRQIGLESANSRSAASNYLKFFMRQCKFEVALIGASSC